MTSRRIDLGDEDVRSLYVLAADGLGSRREPVFSSGMDFAEIKMEFSAHVVRSSA